jgi:hypothetical protein
VRVDTEPVPPCGFIAAAVDLAMVNTAERHRELVTHLATERTRLRRAKMMRIAGLTATDKAGLRGNELKMRFVADAPRCADRKHAFVDAATDARVAESAGVLSRIVSVQPRTRCCGMGQHFAASRWGLLGIGIQKARLRAWRALEGLPRTVIGPPIAECRELCPEACFDKVGVGGR